ncbi:MAG: putative cysteine protease YraA [Firmicutes bacterium ADurb.Bin153]|nr:MAG: putative cysteine protease YraA [Firmicutes bacterium ADurb.Bin153]HPU95968.1 type 1 glutamine amidotransferase domain-containing protein [Bacillota bacterium]
MGTGRAAILLDNLFQDLEVMYPYYRLLEAGFAVDLVGPERGRAYTGKFGYPALAGKSYQEARQADYDVLVIPGGFAPDKIRMDKEARRLTWDMVQAGKAVGAICHGPWVLVSAGVVRGRNVTSYAAIKDDLVNAGGLWQDLEVVTDGNLVTSRKPDDLPAFMKALLSLAGK